MIEFIIIEKEELYINKYKNIIIKEMLKNDYEYKITINPNNISKDNFKVYIISYNDKIINKLRTFDWSSMLIITTSSKSNISNIINNRWMPIDIIMKTYDFDKYFTRAITISLKNYINKPNTLRYIYKNTIYNLLLNQILLIYKEKEEKRCIIKTIDGTYFINDSITAIMKKLNSNFIKCNRGTIINFEQVKEYNIKKNIIIFNNGLEYKDISRNCRKDIVNYLRRID